MSHPMTDLPPRDRRRSSLKRILLMYILILANRETVLGVAKNSPRFKVVATLCVAVVGLLSFVVLVQTVFGLV